MALVFFPSLILTVDRSVLFGAVVQWLPGNRAAAEFQQTTDIADSCEACVNILTE